MKHKYRLKCTNVTWLPPCLSPQAVLFSLSSLFVSLCLLSPFPPHTPLSVFGLQRGLFWLVVFYLLVWLDGVDNFTTLIWLKFGFCFGRTIPKFLNWAWFELNLCFGLLLFTVVTVTQLVLLVALLGFILVPFFGDFEKPVGTRRNGRFLAIWTHPHGRARPLLCSSNAHSCSGRTRSLSSPSH